MGAQQTLGTQLHSATEHGYMTCRRHNRARACLGGAAVAGAALIEGKHEAAVTKGGQQVGATMHPADICRWALHH